MLRTLARARNFTAVAAALVAAFVCAAPTAGWSAAGSADPQVAVYPPNANPYGRSLGEWTASWWQWAFSMPVTANPLMETGDCATGQAGPVWFLGGSFVNATTTRACTIPAGRAILLPVLNSECSTVEPDPFHGENEAELRACAASFIDATSGMFATIDGQPVRNLANYRTQSPLFDFSAPDNSVLGPGPVSGQSVSDGVWVFLPPLSAGNHTIHFGGVLILFGNLTLDVTYNITVQPGGRGRGQIAGSGGEPAIESTTWGLLKTLYR